MEKKIWNITLPCIRSTIVVMLIMSLGRILGISFERPYTLDNPLVRDFSDVISTFVYRVGLQSHRYNIATAVGLFQSVVGLIFVFASDKFAKLMGRGRYNIMKKEKLLMFWQMCLYMCLWLYFRFCVLYRLYTFFSVSISGNGCGNVKSSVPYS